MNIEDSGIVKNRIQKRSFIIAFVLYLVLIIAIGLSSLAVTIVIAIYSISAMVFTTTICQREIASIKSDALKFKKSFPFRYFGCSYGDFQHVFYHKENLETEILSKIIHNLKKTPIDKVDTIEFTDIDKDLKIPEKRYFVKADSGITKRGTSVTLMIRISNFGGMQSVRWWVLAGGYIDKNKKFNFIAYSPFSLPFWIIVFLKKEHDVISNLRTVYSGNWNYMDMMTQIRCLHQLVFDSMVSELEKHGIDTSDIKAQRLQAMNFNISGGWVNMGNISQGNMNNLSAK